MFKHHIVLNYLIGCYIRVFHFNVTTSLESLEKYRQSLCTGMPFFASSHIKYNKASHTKCSQHLQYTVMFESREIDL